MTTDDGIRASDGDRDGVVAILREAYVAGRLTLAEFDERTSAAFASRTWGELRKLTRDLPARLSLGTAAEPAASPPGQPARLPPAGLPPTGLPGRYPASAGMARLLPALPIVAVWVVIALSARGAGAYLPLLILLIIGLRLAGGRPHHHGGGGPGQQPPQRGPGQPF